MPHGLRFDLWYVPHGLISQELKKLQQAESLPFCPIDAAFFLLQCCLATRAPSISKDVLDLGPLSDRGRKFLMYFPFLGHSLEFFDHNQIRGLDKGRLWKWREHSILTVTA